MDNKRGYNEVLFRLPTEIISKEELIKKINDWQNGKIDIDVLFRFLKKNLSRKYKDEEKRGYNEVLFRFPTEIISKEELVKKINDWQNGKIDIDVLLRFLKKNLSRKYKDEEKRGYNEVLFRFPTEIISKEELVKKIQGGKDD